MLPLVIRPARPPARLLIAPQDIRVADPTVANDIYAGYFAQAGRVLNAHGRSPFRLEAPSAAWAEGLHGFGWLRHLRAADTALARANARALCGDWIASVRPEAGAVAWRPAVIARRLLSWLSQSPVILEGADGPFYRAFLKSLMQQAALLHRALAAGLEGEDRLWATLALAEIGLCVDAAAPTRRSGPFLAELDRQILADGGHVSRDPQVLVTLLLDLLPLRQAYAARGAEVPSVLLNAIDRMLPMLRLFRHSDGSLGLFNGMGVTQVETVAVILAYDDVRAAALTNAPYSGYQRAVGGDSVLLMDTGQPPPSEFSSRAHAGTLAFEFSTGHQPLVVNCGHPATTDRAMTAAARTTAAHSTLVLDDTSSTRFSATARGGADRDGVVVGGPAAVTVTRTIDKDGAIGIEASHDGYAASGFHHRRRLTLEADGLALWGEDTLVPTGTGTGQDQPVVIRFHLHPAARPVYEAGETTSVRVRLADGAAWRFECEGCRLAIEESIYFGSAGGWRRTEQIVIQLSVGTPGPVRWWLHAVEAAPDLQVPPDALAFPLDDVP